MIDWNLLTSEDLDARDFEYEYRQRARGHRTARRERREAANKAKENASVNA